MFLSKPGGQCKPPPFLSAAAQLRGFAGSLGFEGLLSGNINLDLLGLSFGLLGQFDVQHTLGVIGTHLAHINRTGQCERAGEASVLPLNATEVLLFLFLLNLAFTVDGEGIVVDADINVLFVDAGGPRASE